MGLTFKQIDTLNRTNIQCNDLCDGIGMASHCVVLTKFRNAFSCGSNLSGQLNTGDITNRSLPVIYRSRVWSQVSVGMNHTCYLDAQGYAWAVGGNGSGQLGNYSTTSSSSPVSVSGDKQWISITCGENFTLAIDKSSYAWAWGNNTYCQLGFFAAVQPHRSSPISIPSNRQWKKLAAGGDFSIGIDNNDYAWAWGENSYGQLGIDTINSNYSSPMSIVGDHQWLDIKCSQYNAIGLDNSSFAWGWGSSGYGQIGDGTSNDRSSPSSVIGNHRFRFVATSYTHGIGLDTSSYMWCWGTNSLGQFGDGTITGSWSPVRGNLSKAWIRARCGNNSTIAIDPKSNVYSFGSNSNGILGDPFVATSRSVPDTMKVLYYPSKLFGNHLK